MKNIRETIACVIGEKLGRSLKQPCVGVGGEKSLTNDPELMRAADATIAAHKAALADAGYIIVPRAPT